MGCYETYLSGPGLSQLAQQMTGQTASSKDILKGMPVVREMWIALVTNLLQKITQTAAPDVIVLGGGLGMAPSLLDHLASAQVAITPTIVQAKHGDASGALGAALFADQHMKEATP